MSNRPRPLNPLAAAERLREGRAVIVDIREADEFRRRHVRGAVSVPLSRLEPALLNAEPGKDVVFSCRSGMRTAANCDRLGALVAGESFLLEGGLDGWEAAGLPVEHDRAAPIELTRQVQIAAGLLVLAGVALGFLIHPALFGLSAFVGAGLTVAGATGYCGMARLLALAPWNSALRP
ncbi:MAG TPA: rhodanese family protein [Caulobacteraceae bacterium]